MTALDQGEGVGDARQRDAAVDPRPQLAAVDETREDLEVGAVRGGEEPPQRVADERGEQAPRTLKQSPTCRAAAWTRTSTWPAPGTGTAISRTASASGGP